MAFTLYRTNPSNGVTYAYRAESYRDPVTKKPKSRRTYLGRVDPETKLIIPKGSEGKRNQSKLGDQPANGTMPVETADVIGKLRAEVDQLKKENSILKEQLKAQENKSHSLVQKLQNVITEYSQIK